MTFAYPWMLMLGAVAAAAPVVVHWLTRPRPTRMPLSTLRFVREAIRQRRATHRLRDFLILALRTAAILLLAAAFAGPQWGSPSLLSTDDAGDTDRVVVLDVSQSMAATSGSMEALQRGRTTAARYLQYRPGLRANLILAGAQARAVFDGPSTNFESLREELSSARALPERGDAQRAFEAAARMLAPRNERDKRRRELVIVSDFQRANWSTAQFDLFPPGTKIQLESIAPAETPTNLALLRAVCRPLGTRQDRLLLEVDIGNYGATARKVAAEATLGDGVYRLSSTCPPQTVTTITEEISARAVGWLWGEARLVDVDDAIEADNRRPLVVQLRGKPTYALVTEQSAALRPSSSLILESVLLPESPGGAANERLLRVRPEAIDNESFTASDLVTVNRCGLLSADAIRVLAAQLRLGRPILYLASDVVDATNLDRLATAAGVELPVRFAPPPAGSFRRDLALTSVSQEEQPFNVFGASLPAVLRQLRFSGGLLTERTGGDSPLDDAVLARYGDGTAALVVAQADGAPLAVINADLAASNIWKTGAFVPLIEELLQRLLPQSMAEKNYRCGEPLVARLPTTGAAEQLQVVAADGSNESAAGSRLIDAGASTLWEWPSPDKPGVYRVMDKDQTVYAAAVALSPEEANLATLPAEVVLQRLAAGQQVHFRGAQAADNGQHDLWKWFVVACVALLLAEVAVLLCFRT